MSLISVHYNKKCLDNLEQNLKLAIAKISNPSSFFKLSMSGALVDAAQGGLGSLAQFGQKYVEDNAEAIAFTAFEALPSKYKDPIRQELDNILQSIVSALLVNQAFVIIMMKFVAEGGIEKLDEKLARTRELKELLTSLNNALVVLAAGPQSYNNYLAKLRSAAADLAKARQKVGTVAAQYKSRAVFLTKVYEQAKGHVRDAQKKIKPTESNPFVTPFLKSKSPAEFVSSSATANLQLFSTKVTAGLVDVEKFSDEAIDVAVHLRDVLKKVKDAPIPFLESGVKSPTGSDFKKVLDDIGSLVELFFKMQSLSGDTQKQIVTIELSIEDSYLKLVEQEKLRRQQENSTRYAQIDADSISAAADKTNQLQISASGKTGISASPQNKLKSVSAVILESSSFLSEILSGDRKVLTGFILGREKEAEARMEELSSASKNILEITKNLPTVLSSLRKTEESLKILGNKAKKSFKDLGDAAEIAHKNVETSNSSTVLLGKNLLASYGVPVEKEQVEAIAAIPRITKRIIETMRDYDVILNAINGYLASFLGGSSLFYEPLSKYIQDTIVFQLESILGDIKSIEGSILATTDSAKGSPNPVVVTSQSYKWAVDIFMLIEKMKLAQVADKLGLDKVLSDFRAYSTARDTLLSMDNLGSGASVLQAKDAQEDVALFSRQLAQFLLRANGSIATGKVSPGVLSLGKSIIRRLDLTTQRDGQIKQVLTTFVNTEFAGEEELRRLLDSISDKLSKNGLDRAADLFKGGDFKNLFKMDSKSATYVGFALQGIAALIDCFDTDFDRLRLNAVRRGLDRDLDLIKIKLDFDFDLAIFDNLKGCLKFKSDAKLFGAKELLCQLVTAKGIGKVLDALSDLVSFNEVTTP
jgi:hypothetical protein